MRETKGGMEAKPGRLRYDLVTAVGSWASAPPATL